MKLVKNNQDYFLSNFDSLPEKLPLGTYTLLYNSINKTYYLHTINDLTLPKKVYGDVMAFANRVCTKYQSTTRNLGVLLLGAKGQGKNVTANAIAKQANLPVIIIPEGYDDSDFISFITDPSLGNCLILFDEFEKFYDDDRQGNSNNVLSLLDGPYNTHHLFIFTANDFCYINNMMKNRPSRVHFLKEFRGLSEDTVREIGKDNLDNPKYVDELIEIAQKLSEPTYDIILSICADCNLYKQSPKEVIKDLNVIMEHSTYQVFKQTPKDETFEGTVTKRDDGRFNDYFWVESEIKKDKDGDHKSFRFDPNVEIPTKVSRNTIVYELPQHGLTMVLKRINQSYINYLY